MNTWATWITAAGLLAIFAGLGWALRSKTPRHTDPLGPKLTKENIPPNQDPHLDQGSAPLVNTHTGVPLDPDYPEEPRKGRPVMPPIQRNPSDPDAE